MPRIFITLILFVAAGLLGVLYARPEWQRFGQVRAEAAELEEISREFDELIENRDALLAQMGAISKDNLGRVDRMLPQGPRASDFLVSMEALTLQSGMALRRIDLVSPEAKRAESPSPRGVGGGPALAPRPAAAIPAPAAKDMLVLPFNVQVAGSYEGFKKFLQELERNLRLIDVEDVSFNAGSKGDIGEFTLKAKTYYQ